MKNNEIFAAEIEKKLEKKAKKRAKKKKPAMKVSGKGVFQLQRLMREKIKH